jgi:hypothetical protein
MSFWRPHTAKLIVKLVLLLVEHIPAIFPTLAPRALGGTQGNREHDNERVRGRVDVFLKVRCIELKKKRAFFVDRLGTRVHQSVHRPHISSKIELGSRRFNGRRQAKKGERGKEHRQRKTQNANK